MRKSNFNTPQLGNTFKRGNTRGNTGIGIEIEGIERIEKKKKVFPLPFS